MSAPILEARRPPLNRGCRMSVAARLILTRL